MGLWTRKAIETAHEGDGSKLRRTGTQIRFFVWMAIELIIYGAMHLWRTRRQAPA